MNNIEKLANIPYRELGEKVLNCIFEALKHLVLQKDDFNDYDKVLQGIDESFEPVYKYCKETFTGLDIHLSKESKQRLPKILLSSYMEVGENSKGSDKISIPSPLNVLYNILTVPDEPQTAAYVLLYCRSFLYETFKVAPKLPVPEGYSQFSIKEISDCIHTFETYTKGRRNPAHKSNAFRTMLLYFLSAKGVFYLQFKNTEEVVQYLDSGKITDKNIEFRKFSYYTELPDASSLMNELSGIPIPMRGADTVFQGGIKTKSLSNLVIRLSGEPGTGKTSFALALAALMSPFDTLTYYISLENDTNEDLKDRLLSLLPEYLTHLSIFIDNKTDPWFFSEIVDIADREPITADDFIEGYLDRIIAVLEEKEKYRNLHYLPAVCPFIIVIDSIRPFLNKDKLEQFINKCKKLQTLIILISPDDKPSNTEIDYMVDVVINLKHTETDTQKEKPTRIFQLQKTRHQIARLGSHVFHFSNKNGIVISPQLPSQIDKREIIVRSEPSEEYYNNFFNENAFTSSNSPSSIRIWNNSNVLIHGYGSSGKAGLALTLLLYPLQRDDNKNNKTQNKIIETLKKKKKVLVVSLLYSEDYYKSLENRTKKSHVKIDKASSINCLCFYSGYLTPEDFINKIII
jgi:KaiC/GvpD/RAD55 family RecA-like ATPase